MDLVKITSSNFGSISVLKNDTLNNENVLSTISFDIKDNNTNDIITTKTKDIPQENRIFSPLTDGEVFISNSALTLSKGDKRILGAKAPDINCLLSMPLVVRGEVIGVVALFNSHKSFSKQTSEQLKPLIGVISASAQYDRFTQLCDTYENAISHSKTVDSLTGLPNYNSALNHIEDLVRAKDKEFTLCAIDIIQFNTLNESYSRAAGDVAILQLANILKESLGENDFVSRLLGDTFILVIEGHLSRDLLESISSIISTPFMIGQDAISLDANMGAVYGPIADISGIKLLRLSYTALEKSRNTGEIAIANPDFYIQKNDASTTLQDISVAFEKGQITLLESPVINCETNEIDFISIAPYWNHPTEGRLSSDRFMGLIETNFKSISNFDFNVVMQAIEKLKSCPMKSENKPAIVISVSHSFLISDYIPKVVDEICSSEGLNPARICFSINDDSSSITEKMICEKVSKLRSIGVKLALSNFDTNTCSLSRLYKLPVDIIQVNKSNRNDSKESSNAIKATVAIGKVYNKMIIVKGIENKSDYDLACDSGALHLQGTYLKSKALNQA
jgi:diguanylate cyclase (GGDEF)-like protein